MEDDSGGSLRQLSVRSGWVVPKMSTAIASSDHQNLAKLARLETLKIDNAGIETVKISDDAASFDDDVGDLRERWQKEQRE